MACLIRRSKIFLRPSIGKRNSNVFSDHSRFQSSSPSSEEKMTNLLQEPLIPMSINPFRLYLNLWRFSTFRGKYDRTFDVAEFTKGCKQAFMVVSKKLFEGDFDGLHGLISEESLNRLRPAVENLTMEQREMLDLMETDIYGHFAITASFEKSTTGSEFFEVLWAYHCFRGMEEYRRTVPQAESISKLLEVKDRFVLANIRIAKTVTPVLDPEWTITYANYSRITSPHSSFKFPSN